jgi:hypothetical protein
MVIKHAKDKTIELNVVAANASHKVVLGLVA